MSTLQMRRSWEAILDGELAERAAAAVRAIAKEVGAG